MALDRAGKALAVALRPMAGQGQRYLALGHELIFIETKAMAVTHRWRLEPRDRPEPGPGGYAQDEQGLSMMAFSRDGRKIAVYYWKTWARPGERIAVTLWDVGTGTFLIELLVPDGGDAAFVLRFSQSDQGGSLACNAFVWDTWRQTLLAQQGISPPLARTLRWNSSRRRFLVQRTDGSTVWLRNRAPQSGPDKGTP